MKQLLAKTGRRVRNGIDIIYAGTDIGKTATVMDETYFYNHL